SSNLLTLLPCLKARYRTANSLWFRCELRSRQPDRVEVHGDQPTQSVQGAPVPGRSDRFMRTLVSPLSALLRARRRTGGRTWCRGGCQLHLALGAGLCTLNLTDLHWPELPLPRTSQRNPPRCVRIFHVESMTGPD